MKIRGDFVTNSSSASFVLTAEKDVLEDNIKHFKDSEKNGEVQLLHLSLTSSPEEKDFNIADKALESLNISHLKDKTYNEISGGEMQLVLLARVLAQQPQVLLLDEPTSHLDFGNQIRTLEVINRLSESGLSVIMTSHYPDHAFLSSNKVAIMNKGSIMAMGSPEDVITEENMRDAYGIDVKVMDVDETRKACIPMQIKI
ncbi:MAG: ABC transporter ATP-binding protein [Methanobacterium paludis]|nr:ABC transporter ATP-binding protein [Methanobacterium paludis]